MQSTEIADGPVTPLVVFLGVVAFVVIAATLIAAIKATRRKKLDKE